MASSHPESFALTDDIEGHENLGVFPVEDVPPIAVPRRDENSISFRHFLQQQTDVVASRHHNARSANVGAVDLVDITIALPDFVQDHLVLEADSCHGHDHQVSEPLDLSVLHQVLPQFASSQRSQQTCIGTRRGEEENKNPSEDGVYPHSSSSSSQSQSTTLPDFLSDGPMYCTNNSNATANSNTHHPFGTSSGNGESRSEMHQRSHSVDTDSQAQQIDRLRRELMEKSRSITHLQNEVARQRSEIQMLREALSETERVAASNHTSGLEGRANGQQSNLMSSTPGVNGRIALDLNRGNDLSTSSQVLHIVETSESLIRKLMLQINALKDVAASSKKQEEDN